MCSMSNIWLANDVNQVEVAFMRSCAQLWGCEGRCDRGGREMCLEKPGSHAGPQFLNRVLIL